MHKLTMIFGISIMTLIASCAKQSDWSPATGDIMTKWAEYVNHDKVLPEYPRPQMVRKEWKNLNGLWNYAIGSKEERQPELFDQKILVPYPIESALSGIKKPVGGENKLWYQRSFEIPDRWKGQRVVLHLGAVDWETTVWINDKEVGKHRGGYDAFSFDITDFLNQSGSQEIVLSVWDPVDSGCQPRGKQVRNPRGIWYTSVTGIWQTVWLEPVADMHIEYMKIIPDVDESCVKITAFCTGIDPSYSVLIKIKDDSQVQAEAEGVPCEEIVANIENPTLWSPDSPFLYNLEVSLINDQGQQIDFVSSYFGMRKVALGKDEQGITRIFLNNESIIMHGPLDQGWWPDGLYTAPTDEALRYDIEITKKLGFNMVRKHVKIEPERWYYWCDKLGLAVWQDMPSGDEYIGPEDPDILRSNESAIQFKKELKCMIDGFSNHPSIIMWVLFNEGWGQFETERITQWIKEYDPTRLVNSASGWSDRGCGDVHDIHSYPGPAAPPYERDRAAVLGEYGGLGLPLLDHTWRKEKNWGYRGFENAEDLTFAYQELTRKLLPLSEDGLCAAVYTQLTDVEIEVNGLMTYDRAVIKMDPERVRWINQGYLAPEFISDDEIFLDGAKIVLGVVKQCEIRYTIDGSEPTEKSALYTAPITLNNTTTIKARAFWENGIQSLVSRFTCKKVGLAEPVLVDNLEPGAIVYYYEGEWDLVPDFSTLTPVFSRTVDKFNLETSSRQEDFGLRFDGYINIPVDGIYTFSTNSDDGSKLYLDNKLLVENDGLHGMTEEYGKVALKAGFHHMAVEFFQKKGGLGLEVYIQGPDLEKQQISSSLLFHKPGL